MRRVAVALLHYPVLDRSGQEITTAVTNLDVHDIARSAYTYGVERYFIVHPIDAQRSLVERVRDHWVTGAGRLRIPDRRLAMQAVDVVPDLASATARWGNSLPVEIWTTSAAEDVASLQHEQARELLQSEGPNLLIVFGTGWGLSPSVHARGAHRLAPILSPRPDGYNHLSVRAAAAILFDRLLSRRGDAGGNGNG
ncbi:MAG TPA: RNA methyltransferase [Polyangiaceae bacterium]